MFRTLRSLVTILMLGLMVASCQKEYSEENGGVPGGGGSQTGTAVYTFDGAPGSCTTPSVAGTYTAGTALTAANKITLIVNVTTAGTYTISTGSANGVTFSGSGTFSTTGPTFIELTSTGSTPTSAGTFNYTPGTTGCSFSITYLAGAGSGSGTAVYTFAGAPNDCTAPVISGTYTAGTALTAANTVKLTVNVTTAGTYTISTATANGIKFSGTGTFAATGATTITLTGTGTPTSASTTQYTPGTNGCAFSITVAAGGGGGTPGTNSLKATVSGVATEFNTGVAGTLLSGMAGIPSALSINGSMSSPTAGADNLSVAFTNTTAGSSITTGAYPNISITNQTKGVIVILTDAAGVRYQSGFTANTFTGTVTTVSATSATGTFSGTLYKNGSGPETKAITNGSFSVTF